MSATLTRRRLLGGLAGLAPAAASAAAALATTPVADPAALRAAYRRWLESLPAAPTPALTRHGLVASEIGRWPVLEANQAAAVDGQHFYGIGNHALVKHRKDNGERVA